MAEGSRHIRILYHDALLPQEPPPPDLVQQFRSRYLHKVCYRPKVCLPSFIAFEISVIALLHLSLCTFCIQSLSFCLRGFVLWLWTSGLCFCIQSLSFCLRFVADDCKDPEPNEDSGSEVEVLCEEIDQATVYAPLPSHFREYEKVLCWAPLAEAPED